MTADTCEVVITSDDPDWLTSFSRTLIEERLCACGQQITPIRSIFRWEGVIHDTSEARVALHTQRDLVPRIIERAKESHSYQVPCVIVLPIIDGNPEYMEWIRTQTNVGSGES